MHTTTIQWGDGYLKVGPSFPDILLKKLKYWRRTLAWSEERMARISTGQYEELYSVERYIDPQTQQFNQTLLTSPGFMHRVKTVIREAGWDFRVIDERTPMPKPDLVKACSTLYDYQVPCAYTAIVSGGGIIACPTGWGKTHQIAAICKAFKRDDLQLRGTPLTVVATPDKDITEKDYDDLCKLMPDREIGLVMSGSNKFSDDIQVITMASLHRIDPDDVGVLIVDEVHAAASDKRADAIARMKKAAKWGVSATPDGRFDGRDLVTEGMFGPVVYHRTYADGVKDGALVPITVYWVECPEPAIGMERYNNYKTRQGRYRQGVWRNANRNRVIGEIMKRLPPDMQTLCIMQYLDQMDALLPHCGIGTEIVHAQIDPAGLTKHRNLHAITAAERKAIYQRMKDADIKRILSTHVYKQGVNFPHLAAVINAGGGGSDIVAKQIPGRESRKTATKDRSILIDFSHPWDRIKNKDGKIVPGYVAADDLAREKAYTQLGFEQIWIKDLDQMPILLPCT